MIKNIVFDLGGVLLDFNPDYILDRFYPNADTRELFREKLFEDWNEYDLGLTQEEMTERVFSKIPENYHQLASDILDTWVYYLPHIEAMIRLLYKLKGLGYKLYLLSNAPAYFSEKSGYYKFLQDFDGIIFSGDIKMGKPDRKIFEYAAEHFAIKPNESIFVDDRKPNIDVANECGFKGFLFGGNAAAFADFIESQK